MTSDINLIVDEKLKGCGKKFEQQVNDFKSDILICGFDYKANTKSKIKVYCPECKAEMKGILITLDVFLKEDLTHNENEDAEDCKTCKFKHKIRSAQEKLRKAVG
jgi:hypothetical protein